MTLRVGVVTFPGSNGDRDMRDAINAIDGLRSVALWHGADKLPAVDAVILPGGFAHGDHLRPGAIARFSPVMRAVGAFAARGGPVLGVCNGFQILCEAGWLPGALVRNRDRAFVCRTVGVRFDGRDTAFTRGVEALHLPIAHGAGRWVAPEQIVAMLEAEGRIILRYEEDINGSVASVAGVCNASGNVVGMMPHPERACDSVLGSTDGTKVFSALTSWLV